MPTRREFLLNCSAVAVAASVTPTAVLGAPRPVLEVPLEEIRMADFAARLHAAFLVQDSPGSIMNLQLVEVQPTPDYASPVARLVAEDAGNEKFSLLLRGPLEKPLEQGSYWFETQRIGRFAMFIVPIGSTETTHCYYEAVFNRPPGGPLPQAGQGNIPRGSRRRQPRGTQLDRIN